MWQLRRGLNEYSEYTNHGKTKEEKHTETSDIIHHYKQQQKF